MSWLILYEPFKSGGVTFLIVQVFNLAVIGMIVRSKWNDTGTYFKWSDHGIHTPNGVIEVNTQNRAS